jgi:hypothetical protein
LAWSDCAIDRDLVGDPQLVVVLAHIGCAGIAKRVKDDPLCSFDLLNDERPVTAAVCRLETVKGVIRSARLRHCHDLLFQQLRDRVVGRCVAGMSGLETGGTGKSLVLTEDRIR